MTNNVRIKNTLDTKQAEFFILPAGILLRLICFISNLLIGGYNSDENIMALNAFSVSDTLADINGRHLPIYFDAWVVGGQSPFAVYASALSTKLFGHNIFSIRLPMLIMSIFGFLFFLKILDLVFDTKRYRITAKALACISPWMLFSGAYVLDCNYLAHILIAGSYFLLKAINTEKSRYYIISMLFFGIGFYCYIASVLIIPVILLSVYLILLIKKRITVLNLLLSVAVITATASLFILYGLVQLGIINDIDIFGISITRMPNYARNGSVLFFTDENLLVQAAKNAALAFIFVGLTDINAIGVGNSIFQFGNLFSGLFLIIGAIAIFKKRKEAPFLFKVFALICVTGILFFCILVNNTILIDTYRYGILSYYLIFIEAIGIVTTFTGLKRVNYKKAISAYLALSLALFSFEYGVIYARQTDNTAMFADSLFKCEDILKEKNQNKTIILTSSDYYSKHCAVFSRYYYYGSNNNFVKLSEEMLERSGNGNNRNVKTTTDDSVVIITESSSISDIPDNAYFIAEEPLLKYFSQDDFEIIDCGYCNLLYKRQEAVSQ